MSRGDLLIEIGTEEIPAGFIMPALESLRDLAAKGLSRNRIEFEDALIMGTPRRLVLHVKGVVTSQPDGVEEAMGPSVKAAFDASGNPTKAAEGFARGKGVDVKDLIRVTTDKGEYIASRKNVKGVETAALLATLIPEWIGQIPFKKSMRWGAGETAFARPIHWILALFDGEVVPFEYAGVASGRTSRGHRFHAPEEFEVMEVADYQRKIRQAGVVVDISERRDAILAQAREAAQAVGATLLEDPELLDTVTCLVEQPTAVAGSFEAHYLDLPRELLILTMKTHQKYFAVVGADGRLTNHFVTISNTRARDLGIVARGNERVLRARLSDARFFFDEDTKETLEQHAEGLKKVVFQSKLGTSWDKVVRFRAIANRVADVLCPASKATVDRIAHLAKADLVTAMVFEFPEIQGIVGREYALRAGESKLVATGIHEHYRPTQAGGELPSTVEADCVSIADKIDTLAGCFGVGLIPSGTADPYALRRQTIGILRILTEKGYRLKLGQLVDLALDGLGTLLTRPREQVRAEIMEFFRARLEVLMVDLGYGPDAVAAILGAGFDEPVDAFARLKALEEVRGRGELAALAGTFRRVANILKGQEAGEVNPALLTEEAEKDLWAVYSTVRTAMAGAVERGDYGAFFTEAARLKVVVDTFFEKLMVIDPDESKKRNRIALMAAVTGLFGSVADFTKVSAS